MDAELPDFTPTTTLPTTATLPIPAPPAPAFPARIGTEHPSLLPRNGHLLVERTFIFSDLSGFTAFTKRNGPHASAAMLAKFRHITRQIAASRGVRVAKWLGDGAMLVGVEPMPAIALGAHLVAHYRDSEVGVRVGIASGTVLLFEGDDYIGEPVNLAAKLCAARSPVRSLPTARAMVCPIGSTRAIRSPCTCAASARSAASCDSCRLPDQRAAYGARRTCRLA